LKIYDSLNQILYILFNGKFRTLVNTVGIFGVEVDTHTAEITGKTFEWK
jgi:hypothetical protein